MLPIVQLPDVLPDVGAPDAGVALDVHVVAQSEQALGGKAVSRPEPRSRPRQSETRLRFPERELVPVPTGIPTEVVHAPNERSPLLPLLLFLQQNGGSYNGLLQEQYILIIGEPGSM